MIVGYARVSSTGQDHAVQVERLTAAGAEKIFSEKQSGLDRERAALDECLRFVREGDVLLVTKLDRLARSAAHLHQIVEALDRKGVGFRVLDDPSLDTTTRTGKLVFGILASIAEFETALRKERQLEGIAKAKAKAEGRTGGRPATLTPEIKAEIGRLSMAGESVRKIAGAVGFSKSAVQKVLDAARRGVGEKEV
jgi:DNA invertase Pin-like site-specific DNA recombinase